ncbi:DUF3857 domain-containing transglutaminase family protein [Labilibacter marinus]|uniref:DUF3857 domain-containing transglutaminase family protein n=1 Tax=Labilibacter marinus TaxID=1477105 RepID=UPI00082CEEFC|nr:DUF3857 domain-containing protein [Labilibacter marinus]
MRLTTLIVFFILPICVISQTNNCEIISYDTKVVFNGNKVEETLNFELQINNGAGTKYAEISIPFSKNDQVINLKAAIYDIFGNKIRTLKKKDITIETPWSNINFYSDRRLKSFKLIHSQYPYILKYSYTNITNDFISLAHWSPIYYKKLKVKQATLSVEIPSKTNIHLYQHSIDSATITQIDNKTIYQWEVKDYTPLNEEAFSPTFESLNPCVIIMPKEFHYGVDGSSNSWADFGNWKHRLISKKDIITEEEKNKIHALTDTIANDWGKVKAVYHYIQDNTRYINISEDLGGLTPHPASYVCTNKYGDCKALSNYTMSLLKEIGITAYYTTVYAGVKPIKVKSEIPTHQSNHIILSIPLSKDTIWLECTNKTEPFNYLSAYTQNRLVLPNKETESQLVRTPTHTLDDALENYSTTVNMDKEYRFSSIAHIKGLAYDSFKGFDTALSEKEKKSYIDGMGFSHKADIQSFNIERPHRDSAFLQLKLEGTSSPLSEKIGSKLLVTPFRAINYKLTPVEKRKTDIWVYYPVNRCDTIIYSFDKKINNVSGLTQEENSSPYGHYNRTYTINGNQLIVHRTFQLYQNEYDFGEYEDFYAFISQSCQFDHQKMIISF